MNPIAENALKRARLVLPTSVLDEPEDFAKPAPSLKAQAPTPVSAPAQVPAPVEEEKTMQTAAQLAPVTPARTKGHTARPGFNSRIADKFVIRLPDGVRERVKEHSARGMFSMNTFIVRATIRELDRLEGVETPMTYLEDEALPVAGAGAGTEGMEALVLRMEAAIARLESAQ